MSALSPSPRPPPELKKGSKKNAPSLSRSPPPTALLERELHNMVGDGLSASTPSPQLDTYTDLALELDLAANATPDIGTDPDILIHGQRFRRRISSHPRQRQDSYSHSHHMSYGCWESIPLTPVGKRFWLVSIGTKGPT